MPRTRGRDKARDLHGAFEAVRERGFDWSKRNCGLGAASMAAAVLRRDLAAPYRAECRDAKSALAMLKRKGGLRGIMLELGLEEIKPIAARRGDVVLFEFPVSNGRTREALGTALDYRAAFPGAGEMVMVPLAKCGAAWRLPVDPAVEVLTAEDAEAAVPSEATLEEQSEET